MKTRTSLRFTSVVLAAIALAALASSLFAYDPFPPAKEGKSKGIEAKAAFEHLKSLAGSWEGTSNEMKDKAVVRYQVTSGGSVVMETLAPGGEHEMITMYHLDGDDLLLTHYCAAQNQPRMKLNRKKSTADELVFEFVGGTNIEPKKTGHMHGLRILFTGADTVEAHWVYFQDGKSAGTTDLKFARNKS